MSHDEDKRAQQIREAAQRLAERLASPDGRRAMAEAAEATRRRAAETVEAARVDPKLLQRRVTF